MGDFMIGKNVYFKYDGLEGKGIVVRLANDDFYTIRLVGALEGLGHDCNNMDGVNNYWYVPKSELIITDNRTVNYYM